MMHRLIITRPAPDAARWVHELGKYGIRAQALPLLEIAAAGDPQALPDCRAGLQKYSALMFVSVNAVEHFFAGGPSAEDICRQFPQLRMMAPGPGTVRALLLAGVPDTHIDAPMADAPQFDSAALWQEIGDRPWDGTQVLIVRGESSQNFEYSGYGDLHEPAQAPAATSGRDWLARKFERAGAHVDFIAVYQRRAPMFTAEQVALAQAAAHDGSVWLFSSSESVANLGGLPPTDWSRAHAIATHPRIVATAREAGWGVVVASRPGLDDIRAAFASIESFHHE